MTTSRSARADGETCGLVTRLSHQLADHIRKRAATLDLTSPQAIALRELTEPMPMRALAVRMSCEPSNVTFVIDKLEQQGYVERTPDPDDRRAKLLVLTPSGTKLRTKLVAVLTEESPLGTLSDNERTTLHKLLQRALES
ncbi:MarR family winged helix-turn-helix transcriptional regulator [Herbihabitans rhizosphaerae]|uniref:MarR family winged helix-turn-helix transcriptional regulator n=1 Tax=Herbihabitans rhizosphaerae TaxID=1872711 RepID=UPI001F5EA691|nr:MarR family transcriptional regulator [Herbihabitans rhizosphaerae]